MYKVKMMENYEEALGELFTISAVCAAGKVSADMLHEVGLEMCHMKRDACEEMTKKLGEMIGV